MGTTYLSSTTSTWMFLRSASVKIVSWSVGVPEGGVLAFWELARWWRWERAKPAASRGLWGGVELPRSSDVQPDTDISDRNLSGIDPTSIKGEVPLLNWGLLNGMEKVALVPVPRAESSVISPCIKSTSCQMLAIAIQALPLRSLRSCKSWAQGQSHQTF